MTTGGTYIIEEALVPKWLACVAIEFIFNFLGFLTKVGSVAMAWLLLAMVSNLSFQDSWN